MLPEPITRSPGSIKLLYGQNEIQHTSGARLVAGVDINDLPTMRTAATGFADALKTCFPSFYTITGWRICDPAGATLYEEAFVPAKAGTRATDSGDKASQSTTHTLVGKGTASVVGEQQGQTRTVVYRGTWREDQDTGPRVNMVANQEEGLIKAFLEGSQVLGADFYGQQATYKPYVNVQINAHWQKRYGF